MGIIFSCSNNSQCLCAVTVMIKINLSAKRMNCRCVLPCSIYKQVTVEICSAGFIINAMRSYITTASSSPFSAVTGSSYFSTTKKFCSTACQFSYYCSAASSGCIDLSVTGKLNMCAGSWSNAIGASAVPNAECWHITIYICHITA